MTNIPSLSRGIAVVRPWRGPTNGSLRGPGKRVVRTRRASSNPYHTCEKKFPPWSARFYFYQRAPLWKENLPVLRLFVKQFLPVLSPVQWEASVSLSLTIDEQGPFGPNSDPKHRRHPRLHYKVGLVASRFAV